MGKKEITEDFSSTKEKKKVDKSDKKSKKGRSKAAKQVSSDSHDGMAVEEPVIEEPRTSKKSSKRRRLELETPGDVPADVPSVLEDSEVPKKKRKERHSESESTHIQALTPMDIDGQQCLDAVHRLETKGAGLSDARPKKEEKKSRKNKKTDHEQPGRSPLVALSPEDAAAVERPELSTGGAEGKRRKKEKKNSESLTEPEAKVSSKKRSKAHSNKTSKSHKNDFADPQSDESLDPQARKALEYAFTQFNDPSEWKFNKAKQNWIIRNVWSSELIPETYFSLAMEYISKIQGGSRDKLREQCDSVLNESLASTEANDAGTAKAAEDADSTAQSPIPKLKSILKSSAPNTSQPLAGAIIDAPLLQPTVDIKRQRAKLLLAALTQASS